MTNDKNGADDRLDERLRQAAQDYHRPPATPRDEMWEAISRARAARAADRRVVVIRPWLRWGMGIAAVLALGIAIGRLTVSRVTGAGGSETIATAPAADTASAGVAYQVATTQYLSRTEALLTGFRAERGQGPTDPHFVAAARDLLGTTRLMLDSPAARDPRLKALLEDLELVLAQITQLPSDKSTDSRDLITQGLEQRSVLPRLRTAIPAGPTVTRVQGVL